MLPRIALAFVLCASVSSMAHSAVLVVDIGGAPGTHPDIQSAVFAAQDGDLILVRPGDYSALFAFAATTISGKTLTILADPPGSTVITAGFAVSDLPAGKTVVIRGLEIAGATQVGSFTPPSSPGVAAFHCEGTVLVEDCTLQGGIGGALFNQGLPGNPGLLASNASITAVRCSLRGGDGYPGAGMVPPGAGGPGALAQLGGSIALFECTAIGSSPAKLVAAGPGAEISAARILVSGSALSGGDAQAGCATCAGGDGLKAVGATSQVRWIDSTFTPGSGAFSPLPIDSPPGVVASWTGTARSWTLTSHVLEFQPVAVDIQGVQGDAVLFVWSPVGAHLPVPGLQAWLVVGAPLLGPFFLTTITSPDGHLAFNVNAPALVPATLDHFTFQMQPIFGNGGKSVAGGYEGKLWTELQRRRRTLVDESITTALTRGRYATWTRVRIGHMRCQGRASETC